ncbi:hypothetical protein MLD38_000072 [Melastoma candidum]|uniref:Uncharacterized protein n=1 Tax=Melastoma candidum TaxID=119954 RepID=A0ACB9S8Y4_9MYRT|nr:hypothetical protein MLD38_000072 [Melastoma candidum]
MEEPASPTHIFILSGQSNMAGHGGAVRDPHHHHRWDGVVPPECAPNPSILRLTSHLHWELAREPLHHDINSSKVCGVGPGMSFANALIDKSYRGGGATIGLVPCAVGGTEIREWARGERLYENMVRRARASVGGGQKIMAVLWYQGESDTKRESDAVAYRGRMKQLICDLREDLSSPTLPLIQVAIASGDEKHIEKVREAQLGIQIPGVVCVDAKGLPLMADHIHLTTDAQVRLGHMLAAAYLDNFEK